ncbi:MAG TPA: TonB-dependent receptor, partial [Rhodanobacter sp.]|nr:TonB-dependent receptor [Rhodanobacter sp.]
MTYRCALQGAVAPVRFHRRPLAAACAVALIAFAGAGPAFAQEATNQQQTVPATVAATPQDAGTAKTDDKAKNDKTRNKKKKSTEPVADLSRVVVTGISSSIASSMKAKEDSSNIVEAISAEDIGKLPDVSIADSLSRVSGLATQRADGHANGIAIRGLSPDFAGTTLDGREQATVGENRGVEYDQYPAELISGVTIYKTPDASLVGQGLSGTVDLHTINPLDLSNRVFVLNARGEHNTNGSLNPGTGTGTSGHRASFSYVDQFLDHTLGVAVGVATIDEPIQEKQYQAWWWSVDNGSAGIDQNWGGPHTPGMPDNVISQEGMQLRAQSQNQKRNGVMAVLEWAPNDVYYSKLDLYYSTFNKKKFTNGAQWDSSPYSHSGNVSYDDVATSPGQPLPIVTSGTVNGIAPILQNEYTKEHDKLYSIGWNNKLYLGDWTATADLSSSSARVKLHDAYLFSGLANGAFTSVDFNTPSGFGYPDFRPAVDLRDPGTMVFTDPDNYGYNGREELDRQVDTIHALRLQASHPLGWIFSDMDVGLAYSDRTKTKHADVLFAYLNGNGDGAAHGPYDNHLGTAINPSLLYNPTSLGYGGIPGILNYNVLGALYGSQFYRVPKNGQGDWSRNYTVEEKVPLAYVKFNINTQLGDIPLGGNVGVQFVHTDQSSRALQTNGNTLVGTIADGAVYNKVLPSLNLKAEIGERQYLRFGLAKTMARGRIDDEKVSTSAGVSQITNGPGAGQVLWSGSGGNPQLRPYMAVGTDLSWEKYFGTASYVAAAVFHKNLLNYIYNQTVL